MTPRRRSTLRWGAFLLVLGIFLGVSSLHGFQQTHGVVRRVLHGCAGWSGLSVAAAGLLYIWACLGPNPGPVMKGWRWPWLQLVLLPFRAVSLGTFRLSRRLGHARPASQVIPGLYVGPRPWGRDAETLAALGIRAVLDLTSELPTHPATGAPGFDRLQVPVLDRTGPDDADLDRTVDWVITRLRQGVPVLVHCAFGRGRSGLVACAVVLAMDLAPTPEAARAQVTRARPSVWVRGDPFHDLQRFHARRQNARGG